MTIVIQSLNDSAILDGLRSLVENWQPLADEGVTVEIGEPPNESPEKCPWVGLYRSSVQLVPRSIGLGAGFRQQTMSIVLWLTESSSESGEQCGRDLSLLVQGVLSAICSDQSLGGTVDIVGDMGVVYSDYRQAGDAFFQTALVTIAATAPVTATTV